MMDIDTLVGRLIDLESKYYELQSKYQTLIHQYEELKTERSKGWSSLTKEEIDQLFKNETKARGVSWQGKVHVEMILLAAQELLKEKNENCSGHRNELGTRYDPFVRN